MTYPALPPPADDLHGRAVWHAQARAWWLIQAQAAKPRTNERRNRLAWASQHEARIVDLAIRAEHNAPTLTETPHHGRP